MQDVQVRDMGRSRVASVRARFNIVVPEFETKNDLGTPVLVQKPTAKTLTCFVQFSCNRTSMQTACGVL